MRGRMSSVFGLVVTGGVRLGDIEAGGVASLTSARTSVLSGGLACIVGVGLVVLAFPSLVAYDGGESRPPARAPARSSRQAGAAGNLGACAASARPTPHDLRRLPG